MYTLKREQQIYAPINKVWDFFSDPKNLKDISPKEMNFIIKTPGLTRMYAGQIIEYSVSPLLGIPLTWVTEIAYVEDQKYFVDYQLEGPYKVWHHQHFFEENEDGVLMRDLLSYQLPFCFIGEMVAELLVKRKLEEIFDYRYKAVDKIFK